MSNLTSGWGRDPRAPAVTAWGIKDAATLKAQKAEAEVRITDLVLFFLLPWAGVGVSGYPMNEMAALVIITLAAVRPPPAGAVVPPQVLQGAVALICLMIVSGVANGVPYERRVGHMLIEIGLIFVLATGRVSLRSAALGLGAALVVISGLALVGVGPQNYGDRLSGWFSDPNAAAYYLIVLGAIAIGFARSRRARLLFLLVLPVAVVLTYSRTGLLAMAMCLVWVFLARRIGELGGVALIGATVWLINTMPAELKLFGPFSNRSGSDALRDRIIAAEELKLSGLPWYGNGPGTSTVSLQGGDFFFHSSYLATRNEGGWLLLLLVLGLLVFAFVRLSPLAAQGQWHAIAAQGSLVAVAAMGLTLGEVFLELPAAIAVGFALRAVHFDRSEDLPADDTG